MYVLPYSWAKKTQGQQRRQAARLKESAKQLWFWSGQWLSDSSCSAIDGSFDNGLGKTLGIGEFPSLDQSAPVYLYWPPGPFLATQYDKEPGGAGFEASQRWTLGKIALLSLWRRCPAIRASRDLYVYVTWIT